MVDVLRRGNGLALRVDLSTFVEKVVVVALVIGDDSVVDVKDAVCHRPDEVPIMRDKHNRAVKALERLL